MGYFRVLQIGTEKAIYSLIFLIFAIICKKSNEQGCFLEHLKLVNINEFV